MSTSGGTGSGWASMFNRTKAVTPPIMTKTKSATMSARMRSAKAMIAFMACLPHKLDCSARSFENMDRQACTDERKTGDNADNENSAGKDLPRQSRCLYVRARRVQRHLRQL